MNNKIIKLQILDNCVKKYRKFINNFNYSLAILVYSIIESFEDINLQIIDLRTNSNSNINIKIFLIGNKNELEMNRKINFNEGLDLSKV